MNEISRLENLMGRLRAKGGCPWDRRQTHKSLKPYLLEETHEVLEAIDGGDPKHLREELGDLLLQVVFHAQMAREKGNFDFQGVAKTISDKLVRRHPHVFAKGFSRKISHIKKKWEEIKREEKPGRKSSPDGLPASLPALLWAQRFQDKISGRFPLPGSVREAEKRVEGEWKKLKAGLKGKGKRKANQDLGRLLFSLALLAHHQSLNAEMALREANRSFAREFRKRETRLPE